jgi:excisionase family DNA binding protein
MLGVSRPHVAKLVDAGRLQGRRVNKHRRVRLASVIAFKREMDRRNAVLDELAELSQEMGLYDIPEPERSNG